MSMSFKLNWNGNEVIAAAHAGAVKGLHVATEHILGESRKIVPIEEATLERSAVASVDEGSLSGAVSYDTPYSVIQHERLDFRHDEGRSAKYLEIPFVNEAETVQKLIAAEIRRSLR